VINHLFSGRVDPVSGQPDSKRCAVTVRHQPVRRWLRALLPPDAAAPDRLDSPFKGDVATPAFWCRSAQEDGQRGLEWACAMSVPQAAPAPGMPEADWAAIFAAVAAVDYIIKSSERAGARLTQVLLLRDDHAVGALACAPDLEQLPAWAELGQWLQDTSQEAASWSAFGGECAPADRSPIICSCHEVSRAAIEAAIACGNDSVEALGMALRCGTNCGSCVPELNAILRSTEAPVALAATGTR
ncbi:MAG: (2Fe-2S)-binding protein, partial [Pseudomonadota bacterium]